MAGLRVWVSGLSAVLFIVASAQAFNDCLSPYGGSPISAPTISVPARPPCPCMPEPQIRYACPTPAPASFGPAALSNMEPPLATKPATKQGPMIYQNRTFSGVPQMTEQRRDYCKVTFWNLSGFPVRLTVGDRSHEIDKDKAVTFDLNRSFTWKTHLHSDKAEAVADDLNHFDVLIK